QKQFLLARIQSRAQAGLSPLVAVNQAREHRLAQRGYVQPFGSTISACAARQQTALLEPHGEFQADRAIGGKCAAEGRLVATGPFLDEQQSGGVGGAVGGVTQQPVYAAERGAARHVEPIADDLRKLQGALPYL